MTEDHLNLMPRELRERKSQPHYAADEAGPSERPVDENPNSGSDFALEDADANQVDMDVDEDQDDEALEDDSEAPVKKVTKKQKTKLIVSKSKIKPPTAESRSSISFAPALARASTRHNYSLPQPHVNHRHRAIPLYRRQAEVERLETAPALFAPGETTFTNSFTSSSSVTMRLGRGWGANIGPGPVWQLLEDRGWYKEALLTGNEAEEKNRRPRVYKDAPFPQNSDVISKACAFFLSSLSILLTRV